MWWKKVTRGGEPQCAKKIRRSRERKTELRTNLGKQGGLEIIRRKKTAGGEKFDFRCPLSQLRAPRSCKIEKRLYRRILGGREERQSQGCRAGLKEDAHIYQVSRLKNKKGAHPTEALVISQGRERRERKRTPLRSRSTKSETSQRKRGDAKTRSRSREGIQIHKNPYSGEKRVRLRAAGGKNRA